MSDKQETTLADALPLEMARVRDEVLPAYLGIGPPGAIAASLMRASLDSAARAMARGDVVAMVRALEDLRGYEL